MGTGQYEDLPCSMVSCDNLSTIADKTILVLPCMQVLRSIGYRTLRVPEVPFEETMRVIPNSSGRVTTGEN